VTSLERPPSTLHLHPARTLSSSLPKYLKRWGKQGWVDLWLLLNKCGKTWYEGLSKERIYRCFLHWKEQGGRCGWASLPHAPSYALWLPDEGTWPPARRCHFPPFASWGNQLYPEFWAVTSDPQYLKYFTPVGLLGLTHRKQWLSLCQKLLNI
jgi:hypothetical protein